MPDNLLKDLNTIKEDNSLKVIDIKESEILTALRVADDEELLKTMDELQQILLDETKNAEEKSDAYDSLKELNLNKGKEEMLVSAIRNLFPKEIIEAMRQSAGITEARLAELIEQAQTTYPPQLPKRRKA